MDKVVLGMTWSGLNSAKLAPRCTNWPLSGAGHPWKTSLGNFGPLRASQGMIRPVKGQLGYLKAILVLWETLQISMNMNLSILEPDFVLYISQPPYIAQKWFCIQKLLMDLSFQRKKTGLKSVSWFLWYWANTKGPFFLGRPVCLTSTLVT